MKNMADKRDMGKYEPGLPPYPGTPRWAKLFGIVFVIVLALLLVSRHLTLGGLAGHAH